jgi:hypothetical protein
VKIVELENEVGELHQRLQETPSIWFPMWSDWERHPLNNQLSFIYIWVGGEGYILPVNHVDCIPISTLQFQTLIKGIRPIYVFGKSNLLHSFDMMGVEINDVVGLFYTQTNYVIDYHSKLNGLVREGIKWGYTNNLVRTSPILKLGEIIEDIIQTNNPLELQPDIQTYNWLNQSVIPTLNRIERSGIRVNRQKFSDRYNKNSLKHLTKDDIIYTEYNPYHLTGRPSNRHGGINFSALNKSDGTRDVYEARGMFLNVDYDAYHLRLISKLIKYQLPQTSAHQYFADQYGTTYDEGKGITFQLLYGGIPDEFLSIPFFNKTNEFIKELWDKSTKNGYIQTPNRRIPLKWIENPNPQKVFNYLLQSVETERNMQIISKVLDFIEDTDVKLVLYTYDSLLLDFIDKPQKDWIKSLIDIIQSGGFPISASWGTDFGKI